MANGLGYESKYKYDAEQYKRIYCVLELSITLSKMFTIVA